MKFQISEKAENPHCLILELNGNVWKEVPRNVFKKYLKSLQRVRDEEELLRKWTEIERKIADDCVLRLLNRKGYFSQELKRFLKRKALSDDVIEWVIAKYIRLGYVDDVREKKRLIEREQKKGYGPRMIAHKLKHTGLQENVQIDQLAAMQHLLETRLKKYDLKDMKQRQKAAVALQRRGFDFELISALLYK
jgi:SOS response regulatory protein OraA/RecX